MRRRAKDRPGASHETGASGRRALEALLTSNLDLIRRIVRHVATRRFLGRQDLEDFEGEVHVKLIEDDYAVLRRFAGRSSLATYLRVVIDRAFHDFRRKRGGNRRPSATARRLGPLAVQLERLVHYEGRSLDDASAILSSTQERPIDREKLAELLAKLPGRSSRRAVGPDGLDEIPAPGGEADANVRDGERQEAARRAERLLGEALAQLSPEDRLLVKLAFGGELTVSRIAVTVGLKQRPLYRRRDRCLEEMRKYLESHGLGASEVSDLLDATGIDLDVQGLKR